MFKQERVEWSASAGDEGRDESCMDAAERELADLEAATGSESVALAAVSSALLDMLSFGIALIDQSRRLLHANSAGLAALQVNDGLRLIDGVVDATSDEDAAKLREALNAVRLGRRLYLMVGRQGSKAGVAVLPLDTQIATGTRLAVLIFERNPDLDALGMFFFSHAHGLTSAEQRLLTGLARGATVGQAAQQIGCAANTARTHVRSVLEKTGEASLRTLTACIGRLPPVATRMFGLVRTASKQRHGAAACPASPSTDSLKSLHRFKVGV